VGFLNYFLGEASRDLFMNLSSEKRVSITIKSLTTVFALLALIILSGNALQSLPLRNGVQTKIEVLSTSQQSNTTSQIKQFQIPTVNSGPNAIISAGNNTFWFVEFAAGKIGEFSARNDSCVSRVGQLWKNLVF
jgi:hypothetical protein